MMTAKQKLYSCLLILLSMCGSLAFAGEAVHSTSEAFYRHSYDYYWSVVQREYDQQQFQSQEKQDQYHELIDIMVRTGSGYGHWYVNIDLGITQMYPRLIKLNPDPPLYTQYRYICATYKRGTTPDVTLQLGKDLHTISNRMDDAGYPSCFRANSWLMTAKILTSVGLGSEPETKHAFTRGMDLLLESAKLEDIPLEYREVVAMKITKLAHISTSLDNQQREEFCYKLFDDPSIDPWVAHMCMGVFMLEKAWEARTAKRVYLVNNARLDMFYQYLKNADAHMTQAWKIRPQWPYAAECMIKITMGRQIHPDRDEHFWFNEATKIRPDYYKAYSNLAYAMTPKWGGSHKELRNFLDHIVEQSETIEHLGFAYMSVLATIAKNSDNPLNVLQDQEIVETLTKLTHELSIERPEHTFRKGWERTLRLTAYANFIHKNYEEAQYSLKHGGGRAYRRHDAWKETPRFRRWMYLLAIDESGDIIKALRASDQGDLKTTLELLRNFKGMLEADPDRKYPEINISKPIGSAEQAITHIELHKRDH